MLHTPLRKGSTALPVGSHDNIAVVVTWPIGVEACAKSDGNARSRTEVVNCHRRRLATTAFAVSQSSIRAHRRTALKEVGAVRKTAYLQVAWIDDPMNAVRLAACHVAQFRAADHLGFVDGLRKIVLPNRYRRQTFGIPLECGDKVFQCECIGGARSVVLGNTKLDSWAL